MTAIVRPPFRLNGFGFQIPSTALPDGSTGYLSYTPSGAATDGKVGTISMWVRLADLANNQTLVSADGGSGGLSQLLWRASTQQLEFYHAVAGVRQWRSLSPPLRDVTAWMHICWQWDTTQATQAAAITLEVNGVEYPLTVQVDLGAYVQNDALYWNSATAHNVFRAIGGSNYFDGYGCALSVVDGANYDASYFAAPGQYGTWNPKTPSGITWGNNGFYKRDLFDTSAPSQGTAHTFTVNGTIAEVSESPTDNREGTVGCHATFDPLAGSSGATYTNGNRDGQLAASQAEVLHPTLGVSSGKFYFEILAVSGFSTTADGMIGVGELNAVNAASATRAYNQATANHWGFRAFDGKKFGNANGGVAYGSTWTNGVRIGVHLDMDIGAAWCDIDGVLQNSATLGEIAAGTTTNAFITGLTGIVGPVVLGAGGTAKARLHMAPDDWNSTPATGFKALNTANLQTGNTITSGTNSAGDFVYTGGSLVSVTWNSVEYVKGVHDGSVIKFYATGFQPQAGAGSSIAWTAVIETELSVYGASQVRAEVD